MSAMPPIDEPLPERAPDAAWVAIGLSFAALPAIACLGIFFRALLWTGATPLGFLIAGAVSEVLVVAGLVVALRIPRAEEHANAVVSWAVVSTVVATLGSMTLIMFVATFGDPGPAS